MVTAGVYLSPAARRCSSLAPDAAGRRSPCIGGHHGAARRVHRPDADRPEARPGVLDGQPARVHVPGPGHAAARSPRRSRSTAAMFHLFTHAFFKALLFLGAGSVMHAMGDVIDMRRFGGLRKAAAGHALDVPVRGRGAGRAAAAVRVLEQGRDPRQRCTTAADERQPARRAVLRPARWSRCFTAGLTAFYTFRAYFLTFWGRDADARRRPAHHAHESPPVMTVPLIVLAVGAVFVGIVVEPFTHWFSDFLGDARRRSQPGGAARGAKPRPTTSTGRSPGSARVLALGGVGLAYVAVPQGRPGAGAGGARAGCTRCRGTSCTWTRCTTPRW